MPRKERLELEIATKVGTIVRSLASYALNRLPNLIIDEQGNIVWQEAFEKLKKRCQGRELTQADIIAVVDELIDGVSFEELDKVVQSLPWWAKGLVASGLTVGRVALKEKPEWRVELAQNAENLILQALSGHPMQPILARHPKLLKFIADYVCSKLKVPRVPLKEVGESSVA